MTRTRTLAIGGGVLLLVVAVAVVFLVTRNAEEPVGIAAPTESPSATPSPTPSAAPTKVVEQPQPFQVRLVRVIPRPLSNRPMFGRRQPGHGGQARVVALRAVDRLERYLNGQFVRRSTRFKQQSVRQFLTRDAHLMLTDRARAALGLGYRNVIGGSTQGATADAVVLHRGRRVDAVTLKYSARFKVVRKGGREERWRQRGAVVLVHVPDGWRAALVDVRLVRR